MLNHIPRDQVISDLTQIFLALRPFLALTDLNARTGYDKGRVAGLDVARTGDFAGRHGFRDEVLLKLGFDEAAALVCALAEDAVFAGAAFENGACETVQAERGDDASCPEEEATAGFADLGEEVFVEGVDEEEALDVAQVTAGEDAAVDTAHAGGDENPGAFFSGDGESFG